MVLSAKLRNRRLATPCTNYGTVGENMESGVLFVAYCKALAHTDIPLLIIHGDEDMQAPLSMAYKLYDSCNGERQLYIVHGADHSENYRKDPGGYEKIVTKFIEERIERKGD